MSPAMAVIAIARAQPLKFFAAGYPTCCESHARYCYMVIWDIGVDHDCSVKMGLN